MVKKVKIIKSEDDDLYEGLPLPEHIDKANDIPEKDIYFKKKKTKKVKDEINRKKNTNRPNTNRNKN